jgi:hypothetical protein
VNSMMEKINRAKMIYKVWLEFQEAAVSGAQAISLGIIPPINPTEPERQHVYVFNNTFFSYGVDSKDAYKVGLFLFCSFFFPCTCSWWRNKHEREREKKKMDYLLMKGYAHMMFNFFKINNLIS